MFALAICIGALGVISSPGSAAAEEAGIQISLSSGYSRIGLLGGRFHSLQLSVTLDVKGEGKGTLTLDPNLATVDVFGDITDITEIAVHPRAVTLAEVNVKDPAGRRVYEIKGENLFLVIPATGTTYRLIRRDEDGKNREVILLEGRASVEAKAAPDKKKSDPDRLKGMKAAIADIEAGKLRLKMPPLPSPAWHAAYLELLGKECGVTEELVTEFTGKVGIELHGYNDVVTLEIEHRFGKGILEKLHKKAMEEWEKNANGERDDRHKIPDDAGAILQKAESFELISLHGIQPPEAPQASYYGYLELGRKKVDNAEVRRALVDAFEKGVAEYKGDGAKCFNPRHGIRVQYDGKTADFVICFECNQVRVYLAGDTGTVKSFLVSSSPAEVFNKVLKEAGITLPEPPKN
jgi:hypothetical protein